VNYSFARAGFVIGVFAAAARGDTWAITDLQSTIECRAPNLVDPQHGQRGPGPCPIIGFPGEGLDTILTDASVATQFLDGSLDVNVTAYSNNRPTAGGAIGRASASVEFFVVVPQHVQARYEVTGVPEITGGADGTEYAHFSLTYGNFDRSFPGYWPTADTVELGPGLYFVRVGASAAAWPGDAMDDSPAVHFRLAAIIPEPATWIMGTLAAGLFFLARSVARGSIARSMFMRESDRSIA
jgi:hypothetical protein